MSQTKVVLETQTLVQEISEYQIKIGTWFIANLQGFEGLFFKAYESIILIKNFTYPDIKSGQKTWTGTSLTFTNYREYNVTIKLTKDLEN